MNEFKVGDLVKVVEGSTTPDTLLGVNTPSEPFKIGELVKVTGALGRHVKVQGKFAIVVSDYYQNDLGLWIDVVIGEKTRPISPYYLERVNAK